VTSCRTFQPRVRGTESTGPTRTLMAGRAATVAVCPQGGSARPRGALARAPRRARPHRVARSQPGPDDERGLGGRAGRQDRHRRNPTLRPRRVRSAQIPRREPHQPPKRVDRGPQAARPRQRSRARNRRATHRPRQPSRRSMRQTCAPPRAPLADDRARRLTPSARPTRRRALHNPGPTRVRAPQGLRSTLRRARRR